MTRTAVIVGFLVAFAAGFIVGLGVRNVAAARTPTTRPDRHGSWLAAELNLTPEQQQQLKDIWSETAHRGGREREDRRRQLCQQRDEAITTLIRQEDRPRFDEILRDHSEQMDAQEREWHSSYEAAVDRTRQILTPEQRAKYEELLQRHARERGPREGHRGERRHEIGRGGDDAATSGGGS